MAFQRFLCVAERSACRDNGLKGSFLTFWEGQQTLTTRFMERLWAVPNRAATAKRLQPPTAPKTSEEIKKNLVLHLLPIFRVMTREAAQYWQRGACTKV